MRCTGRPKEPMPRVPAHECCTRARALLLADPVGCWPHTCPTHAFPLFFCCIVPKLKLLSPQGAVQGTPAGATSGRCRPAHCDVAACTLRCSTPLCSFAYLASCHFSASVMQAMAPSMSVISRVTIRPATGRCLPNRCYHSGRMPHVFGCGYVGGVFIILQSIS